MVTISEEFVANEQVNNCLSAEKPGPAAPQPALPSEVTVTDSAASSDDDDHNPMEATPAPADQPKPSKRSQDNHHASKSQRSKQKRMQDNHKSTNRPASKSEMSPAASVPDPAPQPTNLPPAPSAPAASPIQAIPEPPAPAVTHASVPASPSAPASPAVPACSASSFLPKSVPRPALPKNFHVASGLSAHSAKRNKDSGLAFPHMDAVHRVLALPIVDSGVTIVSGVYRRVKNVNPVVHWSLGTAEETLRTSLERSLSLLGPLSGPLSVVDSLLCRGLDIVEKKVPIITLPPESMMAVGKDYMSMRVVAPVLRVTASNARLANTLAARAIDSADQYVDKYLPGDSTTENGDAVVGADLSKSGAALQRADRLSRKLQRRITRRTLLEARALRKDTENTLHTLVYLAETLVRNPRAFVEQCHAVWNHLSENEPENQVPPETLEERLALLVREVARRVVHLANYTASNANPKAMSNAASLVLKSVREEGTKVMAYAQSQLEKFHMLQFMGDVNMFTHQLLERLAHLVADLRNPSHTRGQPFPHAGTNNIAIVN